MFCPKCKHEYVEGIKVCPECNVDLVHELPDKMNIDTSPNLKIVTAFCSSNPGTVAIAKSILESENIQYKVKNEFMQVVYGIGNTAPAEIQVKEEDKEKAQSLLLPLINNSK